MWAAGAGVLALQYGIGAAYQSRGTWWHYLLHQLVGWGVGLAVAGAVAAWRPRLLAWPVVAMLGGQVLSIAPDLLFRYARMPHTPAMDLWLGHISLHRGPSPVLVSLGVLLLGGASWVAAAHGRRLAGGGLAVATAVLLVGACLLAEPLPGRLSEITG